MIKSKKAASMTTGTIISFILAIAVLLILVYNLLDVNTNFRRNIEACPGTCKNTCDFPAERQLARTCINEAGEARNEQGRFVCCATYEQIMRQGQEPTPGETPSTDPTGTITDNNQVSGNANIQVRRGDSITPINHRQTLDINTNQETILRIWGFGVNQGVCSIYIVNESQMLDETLGPVVEKELCTDPNKNSNSNQAGDADRENIIDYTINIQRPGNFELTIILRDQQGNQIQSAIIPLIVHQSQTT